MPALHRIRLLALNTTAIAIALTAGAVAQPIEQVVVTGTHIRGVAPVGSTVISVGQDDLEKTGVNNTTDLLMRVPQFVNIGANEQTAVGGTRFAGSAGNTTFSRALNLRSVGQDSTLVLFNGVRHVRNNVADAQDIDVYPAALVERIEVVADGASAVYGSDAVAGTVNIVLKSPRDEVQSTFQVGLKDGSMDWLASQTLGVTWDEAASGIGNGGLLLAYAHSYTDPIDAADRPSLYNQDYTPYIGAAGALPLFAAPPNVRGFPGVTASNFPVPGGIGSTQPLELGQLGSSTSPNRQSVWTNTYPLPRITRDTVAGTFEQQLTDWLKFSAFGSYTKRQGSATYGTRPTDSLNLLVSSSNPYSPCATPAARASAGLPPANPANTQGLACPAGALTVPIALVEHWGTSQRRDFNQNQHNLAGKLEADLPYEWHAAFTAVSGKDFGSGTIDPTVNTTALGQVLATSQTTGAALGGKPANVPFFNPFCDPTAAPCNSRITMDYMRATSTNTNTNVHSEYILDFNGPLFDLPGGTVRMAVGGSYSNQSLTVANFNSNTPAIGVQVAGGGSRGQHRVRALYAEAYIPIVGASNAMPGVQALELTLAGRITDYSTFGTTQDPKVGVNWRPVDDLKLHGSWGTSFKAPSLRHNDPRSAAALFVLNNFTCAQYGGQIAAAGNCAPGGTQQISILTTTGGNVGLMPETADTWSIGAEWTPNELDGLLLSVNYFNIDIKNRLTQNVRGAGDVGAVTASPIYDQHVIYNPTYFPTRAVNNRPYTLGAIAGTPLTTYQTNTQAAYDAFILAFRQEYAGTEATPTTSQPAYVIDGRFQNTGALQTDGIDVAARYDFELTDWNASAFVGASGNWVFNYKEAVVNGAPIVDNTNMFGSILRYKVRGEAGFDWDNWSTLLYVNYSPSYDVAPIYLPAAAGPQFRKVASWTTVDLSVTYNTGEETGLPLLRNLQLTVAAQNVFDTLPPLVLNGPGANGVMFDTNFATAVGRYITLRVTKNW